MSPANQVIQMFQGAVVAAYEQEATTSFLMTMEDGFEVEVIVRPKDKGDHEYEKTLESTIVFEGS